LSIIFVVLGLGFLAGGAYAIVEGWPYLLIERGFTLVITGTVLMTAGVLLLALSRVMVELRRVRGQLANAVMAVSVASMANAPEGREPARDEAAASPAVPPTLGGAAAAGVALAAGAAAATPTGTVEARDQEDTSSGEAGTVRREDEPDLFAAPGQDETGAIAEPEAAWPPAQWLESEPEPVEGLETPAAQARHATLPVATSEEFDAALADATGEAGARTTEADKIPDWTEPVLSPEPEMAPAEPPSTTMSSIDEDFDRLRDRLALDGDSSGWDAGVAPTLVGDRREPAESEIDAAAGWMTAIRPGQERWFGTPPATKPEPESPAEPEAAADPGIPVEIPAEPPVWPPQTREAAPFEPEDAPAGELAPDEPHTERPAAMADLLQDDVAVRGEPAPEPADHPEPEPAPEFRSDSEEDRSAPGGSPEPEPEPEAAAPAPAASEEGVVGAYQVGTAHFTIYADGSIQARTPDGDYSFASMDELKTYLASEKSRLNA
jgi:hypothetical protein